MSIKRPRKTTTEYTDYQQTRSKATKCRWSAQILNPPKRWFPIPVPGPPSSSKFAHVAVNCLDRLQGPGPMRWQQSVEDSDIWLQSKQWKLLEKVLRDFMATVARLEAPSASDRRGHVPEVLARCSPQRGCPHPNWLSDWFVDANKPTNRCIQQWRKSTGSIKSQRNLS